MNLLYNVHTNTTTMCVPGNSLTANLTSKESLTFTRFNVTATNPTFLGTGPDSRVFKVTFNYTGATALPDLQKIFYRPSPDVVFDDITTSPTSVESVNSTTATFTVNSPIPPANEGTAIVRFFFDYYGADKTANNAPVVVTVTGFTILP